MRSKLARRLLPLPLVGIAALALASCAQPLESPGRTDRIQFVASTTQDGWKFDQYRNLAYPCAISGYQTFVIGTKVGSDDTAVRPLLARMRGGGVGWFDEQGNPRPTAGVKSEETAATSIRFITDNGLSARLRNDPLGFRFVSVSYCSHDIYAGGDQEDPYNPNTTPDGQPRTVNGLFATKAAIAYTKAHYPTSKVILHGTSAGSAGTFNVAWSMQHEGDPPAGAVSDSGEVNTLWERASNAQGVCPGSDPRGDDALALIAARLHPALSRPKNEPDLLIARGDLTVPILHTWSSADPNVCGSTPMTCPLRDGSTKTLGSADCAHEPMRIAVAGAGPKFRNLRVCVSPNASPGSCATHVVTSRNGTNTDPAEPADYLSVVVDWIHARLAD
jgi:hypothetical protein